VARLTRIRVHRFRNLEDTEWHPLPGRQLVLGANGAGKTSLLEAIYVLATSRSFRSARLDRCCRYGEEGFFLAGAVDDMEPQDISIGWSRPEGLRRELNERETKAAQYLQVLPVVCWWAGQATALTGEPRLRRRMIDQGVVGMDSSALAARERFRHVLTAKRETLGRANRRELAAWNDLFAASAAEMTRLRADYVVRLAGALGAVLADSELDLPPVRLRYRPSPPEALEGEERLRSVLEDHANEELEKARVLLGSQRDELLLSWDARALREGASAGEIKIFGLALTVARAKVLESVGKTPVLLVDDGDAELDQKRVEQAWRILPASLQTLISSSRREVWNELGGESVWRLSKGRIERMGTEI